MHGSLKIWESFKACVWALTFLAVWVNAQDIRPDDLKKIPPEDLLKLQSALQNMDAKKAEPPIPAAVIQEAVPQKPKQISDTSNESKEERFPAWLKRFGYDFFQNMGPATSQGTALPSLPDYILSPGDEIQVYTWGRENGNQTVVLDNVGMFNYSPLPPLRLSGLRFADAEKLLRAEIEKIHGMNATISLGKLNSIRVMVLGEAGNPGSYVVPAGSTVTAALFQSGGISGIGSLRGIQVRRGGALVATLDLYDMLLKGNSGGDIQLVPGDAIFVPVAPIQVAVHGMVKRPAIYEARPGMKALEALELAGGLSSNAFKGRVRLDRIESHNHKTVLDVPMEKIAGSLNPALQDGDVLYVEEVLDKEDDVVYLKGNVNRPGRYAFKKGMTVRSLIPTLKELKAETFFKYGHIKRRSEEDERTLLLPFSLEEIFSKGASVSLEPRDTVVIYSRYDLMDHSVVKTAGMIRNPGVYPFMDQMRISDLLIASGGLTVDAHLPEAHLLRQLRADESDSLYYKLIKVNLSHLVDNPADENNLELRPFDSLIVFPRNTFILPKTVGIYGALKNEGEYSLTVGMGIPELINQAGGLTRNSYKLMVEVVRRQLVGDSLLNREVHPLSLRDLLDGKAHFNLEDGDGIYIREVVNARDRASVELTGEFNFPGHYEFTTGERLSSVIRRAGGFTPAAYMRGAVFIRKSVKEQQLRHVQEISNRLADQMQIMLDQTTDDKERATIQVGLLQRRRILDEIRDAPYLGRVVIEITRDLELGSYDVTLENGDSLWIGPQPNTVSILGEVYSPTNLVFTSSTNSIGECLAKAGGVDEYGDYDNTFYIAPDGSIATPQTTPWYMSYRWRSVEPGGSIIVPPKGPKTDYLTVINKITESIFHMAVTAGVAVKVFGLF